MEHTDAGVLPPVGLRTRDDEHERRGAAVGIAHRPAVPGLPPCPPAPRRPADAHPTTERRAPAVTAYVPRPASEPRPLAPAPTAYATASHAAGPVAGESAPNSLGLVTDSEELEDDLDDDEELDDEFDGAAQAVTAPSRPGLAEVIDIGFGDILGEVMEWQERALCAQTDPEAFFPEKGGSTREAKRICSGCEVRTECLEYALANDERFGIWGGMSERERRKQRRRAV